MVQRVGSTARQFEKIERPEAVGHKATTASSSSYHTGPINPTSRTSRPTISIRPALTPQVARTQIQRGRQTSIAQQSAVSVALLMVAGTASANEFRPDSTVGPTTEADSSTDWINFKSDFGNGLLFGGETFVLLLGFAYGARWTYKKYVKAATAAAPKPRLKERISNFLKSFRRKDSKELIAANARIAQLQGTLQALEQQVAQLVPQNQRLSDDNQRLEGDNQRLTDDNQRLEGDNQRLSEDNQRLAGDNQRLSTENARLQTRLSAQPTPPKGLSLSIESAGLPLSTNLSVHTALRDTVQANPESFAAHLRTKLNGLVEVHYDPTAVNPSAAITMGYTDHARALAEESGGFAFADEVSSRVSDVADVEFRFDGTGAHTLHDADTRRFEGQSQSHPDVSGPALLSSRHPLLGNTIVPDHGTVYDRFTIEQMKEALNEHISAIQTQTMQSGERETYDFLKDVIWEFLGPFNQYLHDSSDKSLEDRLRLLEDSLAGLGTLSEAVEDPRIAKFDAELELLRPFILALNNRILTAIKYINLFTRLQHHHDKLDNLLKDFHSFHLSLSDEERHNSPDDKERTEALNEKYNQASKIQHDLIRAVRLIQVALRHSHAKNSEKTLADKSIKDTQITTRISDQVKLALDALKIIDTDNAILKQRIADYIAELEALKQALEHGNLPTSDIITRITPEVKQTYKDVCERISEKDTNPILANEARDLLASLDEADTLSLQEDRPETRETMQGIRRDLRKILLEENV